MAGKELVNVHKALKHLENLDVSSEDDLSDNEDFISRERLVIYFQRTWVIETSIKIEEMKMRFSQTI